MTVSPPRDANLAADALLRHAVRKLDNLNTRMDSWDAADSNLLTHTLRRLNSFGRIVKQIDSLAKRMDAFEQQRAEREVEFAELPLPPGTSSPDDGHLQAPIAPPDPRAPEDQKAVEDTSC